MHKFLQQQGLRSEISYLQLYESVSRDKNKQAFYYLVPQSSRFAASFREQRELGLIACARVSDVSAPLCTNGVWPLCGL